MTTKEMQEIAQMQAKYLADALKSDEELLDLMFPPRLMDVKEAADYLHMSVDRLYHIIEDVPHHKIGKKLLFTERSLMKWVKNGQQETVKVVEMVSETKKLMVM